MPESNSKGQWLHRTEANDFRRVTWGMTHEEVRVLELDNLNRVVPVMSGAIMIDAQHNGVQLHLHYRFVKDGEALICVGAAFMPTTMDFKMSDERLASPLPFSESSLEEIIKSRLLDAPKLLDTYQSLKELINSDYGPPTLEDGPLQYDPEYVELIVSSDGFSRDQVLQYCRTSVWVTERTHATLSIIPGPLGSRQIQAMFRSVRHKHFFQQEAVDSSRAS